MTVEEILPPERFTKRTYEDNKEELEEMRVLLRREFVEQQITGQPVDFSFAMDGILYKKMDDDLVAKIAHNEGKWTMKKINYAEKMKGKGLNRFKPTTEDRIGVAPKWVGVSQAEYNRLSTLRADEGGRVVKIVRTGDKVRFEALEG